MRVLIIEHEPNVGRRIRDTLEGAGLEIDVSSSDRVSYFFGLTESYDAVILELGSPEIDSLEMLRRWRRAGKIMPVLVLAAGDSWADKVAAMDAGADDYVTKPFHTEILITRLRELVSDASADMAVHLKSGDVWLDSGSGKVSKRDLPVKLTTQEYRLIRDFLGYGGQFLSPTRSTKRADDTEQEPDFIKFQSTELFRKLFDEQKLITHTRGDLSAADQQRSRLVD